MDQGSILTPNELVKRYLCAAVSLYHLAITTYFIMLILCKTRLASILDSPLQQFEIESAMVVAYIASSITTPPIIDIVRSPCPTGYSELTIMRWPGIRSKECQHGGCSSAKPTPSIQLDRWDNQPLCVKRASSVQYGVKNCSPGYIMCPDQYTCIKPDESCPINFLQYSAEPEPLASLQVQSSQTVRSFKFLNGSLQFGSIKVGVTLPSPLYTLQATVSGPPCLDPFRNPARMNSSVYPLILQQKDCGKYGIDTNYSQIISDQDEIEFYKRLQT
jgi:hypothetical protein